MGRTIQEWAEGHTDRDVAGKLADVARGLDHLHAEGKVHCDIKPSNIMVAGAGHPVVIGFGFAKPFDRAGPVLFDGVVEGTPAFMPGQRGQRPSGRSRLNNQSLISG